MCCYGNRINIRYSGRKDKAIDTTKSQAVSLLHSENVKYLADESVLQCFVYEVKFV